MRDLGSLRPLRRSVRVGALAGSRFRSKCGQGRLAHDGASLHAAVLLGRRERISARELGEADPAVEAWCLGASDPERVEPDPRADPTGVRTAVAERQGDHAVRHSGKEPDGKLERAAGVVEADQSSFARPSDSAVFGLTSAGLSHVSLVRGSGSSCSHPSFAKRPS